MRLRILIFFILISSIFLIGVKNTNAEPIWQREYKIKASFIYYFSKFIEWPDNENKNNETISLCIYGKNDFGNTLDFLKDKNFELKKINNVKNADACNILFINPSKTKSLRPIMKQLADSGVLTVSESKGFTNQGGIVNFYIDKNNVRFEINLDVANQAGFKISSKLLKIANVKETKKSDARFNIHRNPNLIAGFNISSKLLKWF